MAYKRLLHGLVSKLGWDDVYAGVRLLIATFIALPLLPNHAIDPWGAINPYELWLLVILISSMSLVGYIATRLLGPDKGAALTGLTGGLVSSTVVALSFAREARDKPDMGGALACGVMLSWVAMFGRILVAVGVVNARLLPQLLPPIVAMGMVSVVYAVWLYLRDLKGTTHEPDDGKRDLKMKNPFNLMDAAKFGAVFAVVLLAVKIVQQNFPPQGLYVVAGLAGLTDVDAISLSMAGYAKAGSHEAAVIAIVIAALSNTIVKAGISGVLAPLSLSRPVIIAAVLTVAIGLGVVLVV